MLVYAGAIMVLFIFVVMILNREEVEPISFRGIITRAVGVIASALRRADRRAPGDGHHGTPPC